MDPLHQIPLFPSYWRPTPASPDVLRTEEPSLDTLEFLDASPLEPSQKSSAVMNDTVSCEKPFEELMYQVLSLLIKEEERATLILRDAICAEKQWQRNLSDLLEKEHVLYHSYEQRHNSTHKITDVILPLSLIAEGMVGIFTGGIGLLPLGAAAFGAFLVLDTVLDNTAKEAVAHVLARGDEEETQSWFQRICMVTNLTIFGLSFCIPGSQAVTLASSTSKLALTCVEAGTEKQLHDQKARLIENEKLFDDSGRHLKELLGEVDRQVQAVNSLFMLLTDLQRSNAQTTARIF